MIEETFLQATAKWFDFIKTETGRSEILWLFSEDLIWVDDEIWINDSTIQGNASLMEKWYQAGRKNDRGIGFYGFCKTDSAIGCAIILPEDEIDMQYRLMNRRQIKMTLKDRLIDANLDHAENWRSRRRFVSSNNENNWKFEIPSKKDLQFPAV